MSIVAPHNYLFMLADEQLRSYYVDAGTVKKDSIPSWLKYSPDAAKDITLQWATNQKYFSTIRQFSNAIRFVKDGQQIINERAIKGAGTEEIMYLMILRANPSKGLNYYDLEYKSRLDFSKIDPNTRTGTGMNCLQDDVFAMVTANESVVYPIQCNSSNPAAIKILFDGTLLQDKLNYSVVKLPSYRSESAVIFTLPISFTNNEGDNAGIIFNSQNYQEITGSLPDYIHYADNANYIMSSVDKIIVTIKGSISFIPHNVDPSSYVMSLFFMKSTDSGSLLDLGEEVVFDNGQAGSGLPGWPFTSLVNGRLYTFNINKTIELAAGEKLFFFLRAFNHLGSPDFLEGLTTNVSFYFSSKQERSIAYGVRGIDVLKSLVSQATNGKYTADSKFLTQNNKKVVLSGSSLRSFPDAVIQTTFSDWYKSFWVPYNLGVTVRNGVLWVEPIEDIYNNDKEILNLGEISEVSLSVAQEYIYTSAQVGYVKQTYNKRNGRYEYNCLHNYKFPIQTVLNKLDMISPYRADSFGMEFIRTSYPNLNSTDDKGDGDIFTVMVTDTVDSADGEISTAISFTMVTLILASPIIKTPFSNTTVYNQNPTITGVAQPFKIITVFANSIVDGTTTSDADGNWSYQIATPLESLSLTFNGIHFIEANAQTDPTNISGFSNVLTLIINTQIQSSFLITAPTNNDTLYNNLPLITGIAPSGKVITLKLDGSTIATLVTNSSGLWRYQITAPLADGTHLITATAPALPDAPPISITVNKNVSSPLITSIIYGDILYNNLPLIKGVAIPGTVVPVYLDGGGGPVTDDIPGPLGTATADANGDWSFQVTQSYDSSGFLTAFIPDGLHVIATTATPVDVLAAITGFQLMRGTDGGAIMDFDAIRLDDEYIPVGLDPASLPPTIGQFLHPETLFNIIDTTPLRCLRAHDNVLKPFLEQQPGKQITFNGAEVNANLVTKKNGIVVNEGANVATNDIGPGIFHSWYLNFMSRVPLTFNDLFESANNDGFISMTFQGTPIKCLPIGNMSMKLVTNEAQKFKLLISSKTPLASLLQLFASGITINLGKNMIYISKKNPLHFVKYNYTPPQGIHFRDIFDDWQKNRFPKWLQRGDFAQPFEMTDPLPLQVITNGVGDCQAHMISVLTGQVVNEFPFAPVTGSVVQLPSILQEVSIDLSAGYPEGQYWFVIVANGAVVAITEKIWLKEDWGDDTLAIDYGGSTDEIDFYFSTGIQPRIRTYGEIGPWMLDSEVDIYEDEEGDYAATRALPLQSRTVQFGNDISLTADWMGIKLNEITLLDNCYIENVHHTRNKNSKFEHEDLGKGVVEFLYKIEMAMAENQRGVVFDTPGDDNTHSTWFAIDARAIGQNSGVINVQINGK